MSWRSEKTSIGQDLVYDGVELGIAPSPSKGTANLQNVNIATETGEVMASYARTAQQQTALANQTLTPDGATNFTGPATLKSGTWISVSASTVSSISTTTTPTTASFDYLIVGGGGAGGSANAISAGGGGGAGEVKADTAALAVGTYAITVGAGGTTNTAGSVADIDGDTSSIESVYTATGGGGGGSYVAEDGRAGASGGGGGGDAAVLGVGGSATDGFAGGDAAGSSNNDAAGGGGGASEVGEDGSVGTFAVAGDGGDGVSSSITGTATYYGGGGGGGGQTEGGPVGGSTNGDGGLGGGGAGGTVGTTGSEAGTAGTANTGGGGGGAGNATGTAVVGGAGGSGIVVISYNLGSMVAVGGDITIVGSKVIHTFLESDTFSIVSINKTNLYYVSYKSGTTFKLSAKFDPTGANALTHGTTGSITFSTVAVPNQGLAKAIEKYTTATSTEYRYYVLDANSYVWVFDSAIYETYGTQWMLPDPNDYSNFRLTGIGALNGLLLAVGKAYLVGKPTTDLGRVFTFVDGGLLNEPFPTHNNFAMVGNQGKMYYCDGNYIGEVFATTSLITSIANIQSRCSYTATTTTGTISAVISGSLPYSPDGTRIPVMFYTDVYGTQPTNVTTDTLYYVEYLIGGLFKVYSAATGGVLIDIASGAAGNQYFTTFWPFGVTGASGATPMVQISTQRVNLPANETAQCLVEVGNTVLIGGKSNLIYPWNQIDATPSDFIALPESDVKVMVNVNNMAYVFAGNKGNIYITNNSVASLTMKVPDYCAGVPGTPLTYIEPTFTWGDADYIRGRVYFSILDQTAIKSGNTGGVWSFIPSQNIDPSQEVGMALRLENQNSYGDYDGYCTIILPAADQAGTSPQYWTVWQDSYSTATSSFGIDYTATTPVTQFVIETDLLPSGTFLQKGTFQQLEYKLTTQLATGDSVQLYYRTNSTDAWTTCGTVIEETTNKLSGYFEQVFQKTQWLQFRIVVTTPGTTASSFVRLKQLMLR